MSKVTHRIDKWAVFDRYQIIFRAASARAMITHDNDPDKAANDYRVRLAYQDMIRSQKALEDK